jgi:hypothetical protein
MRSTFNLLLYLEKKQVGIDVIPYANLGSISFSTVVVAEQTKFRIIEVKAFVFHFSLSINFQHKIIFRQQGQNLI